MRGRQPAWLIHTGEDRGFLMEERKEFRKQKGREERGEQPVGGVGFRQSFKEMFCFVPFGGGQSGRKGQETEMEKEYLNMVFYVL